MESKRKIHSGGAGARDEVDDRAAKRRKFPENDGDTRETPQTTTTTGLRFLETMKTTTDKSGRLIATAFIELPNKRQLPDYYKQIKLPISLDTIQTKLRQNEFPTLTTLEAYFKRMVWNAKEYNEKGSQIYEDAERLRKAASNWMTRNNPAYKKPGFQCNPTPLPDDEKEVQPVKGEDAGEEAKTTSFASKQSRPGRNSVAVPVSKSATPALAEAQNRVGYSGLTFQLAQEKILADMISYKEEPEDDFAGFDPFINLPDRQLKEYYQIIKYPVSLKQIQKRVKGIVGKKAATGVSEFKHWAAFEDEMSFLWKNAFLFNEDDSPISLLAKDLQAYFYKSLKEAKQAVPEPAGPTKIKLKLAEPQPKITLKFGAPGRASPAESPAPLTNGSNGAESSVNVTSRKNPFGGSSSTPVPVLDSLERARSMSGPVPSPTLSNAAPVNSEEARNSPAPAPGFGFRAPSQAVSTPGLNGNGMAPPMTPSAYAGNPMQSVYSQGGYAQSFSHQPQVAQPKPNYESKWRQPGTGAADAMITNLNVSTHPGLNISKHLRMNISPSPTKTQQSVTVNLPSSHYYLQIKPTIAPSLRDRQYKLFVTSGTQRLHAMPLVPGNSVDNFRPLFEARILPGVNRIDVELIAALPKGASKLPNGQDAELEKVTIYANLMK